jgi:hypothetical protein
VDFFLPGQPHERESKPRGHPVEHANIQGVACELLFLPNAIANTPGLSQMLNAGICEQQVLLRTMA